MTLSPLDLARALRDFAQRHRYRRWGPQGVEWGRVRRWVFVCQGNLCRSPFAERWARSRGFAAASCGVNGVAGKAADSQAARLAGRFGVSLDEHQGINVREFPFDASDLVVCFEIRQARVVEAAAKGSQILLLGLCLTPPQARIDDPFGLPDEAFSEVLGTCVQGLEALARGSLASAPS